LHLANESLQHQEWKKGRDIASSVLREMRDRIASGEASGDLLAVALLFRSIGAAGLNEEANAAWDFGVAQSLYPAYERVDLKPYGPVNDVLGSYRYTNGLPPHPVATKTPEPSITVQPPKPLRRVRAEYPLAKRASCVQQAIAVGTVIDETGHTSLPFLPAPTDPVLALAAFDAAREWLFEPATLDSKPVAVKFLLTVDFKIRGC
jgi:hypothetical protein